MHIENVAKVNPLPSPQADISKPMTFELAIKGSTILRFEQDTVKVILLLDNPDADPNHAPHMAFEANLDGQLFKDRQQAHDWAATFQKMIEAYLWDFLAQETSRFHRDAANSKLNSMGIEPHNMRDTIKAHARETEAYLRYRFDVKGTGNYSPWTKLDLTRAVQDALKWLSGRDRNYENVVAHLQKLYGDKAPPSAGALKQLLRRHKINWMRLKKLQ